MNSVSTAGALAVFFGVLIIALGMFFCWATSKQLWYWYSLTRSEQGTEVFLLIVGIGLIVLGSTIIATSLTKIMGG